MILQTLTALVTSIALFLLPGTLGVLSRGLAPTDWRAPERFALYSLLPLAIVPLIFYAVSTVGLNLTPNSARVLLMALLMGAGVWGATGIRSVPEGSRRYHRDRILLFALATVTVLTILLRLWAVREMEYPLWTDSYHHTLIAALIADAGRVPDGYRPYAPIDAYTYHFGVHSLAAFYSWLRGIPVPRGLLEIGQIVNGLAVPGTYLLAFTVIRRRGAAFVAAVVVGLIAHMPAQYVNWGRYTQLAGLTLLPVPMVLSMLALEGRRSYLWLLGAALSATALFLMHYRIFIFYVLWIAPFALITFWRRRKDAKVAGALLLRSLTLALCFLGVTLPWLLRIMSGFGSTVADDVVSGYEVAQHGSYFDDFRMAYLSDFVLTDFLLFVAGAGLLVGLVRHQRRIGLVGLWIVLLLVSANLHRIGIMPLYPTNVVLISLYLPGAILIGYASALFYATLMQYVTARRFRMAANGAALLALSLLSWQGAIRGLAQVAPENGFVQEEDLAAMAWIQQNTEVDALFYIATSFWTPVVAHGIDGGYWLPYLSGRQTIMPPQIYASDGTIAYRNEVNRRLRKLNQAEDPQQLWQILQEYGVTHLYLDLATARWSAWELAQQSEQFALRFDKDGIQILEILNEASE